MSQDDISRLISLVAELPRTEPRTKSTLLRLITEHDLKISEPQIDALLASGSTEIPEEALEGIVGGAGRSVPPWYQNSQLLQDALNRTP